MKVIKRWRRAQGIDRFCREAYFEVFPIKVRCCTCALVLCGSLQSFGAIWHVTECLGTVIMVADVG